MDSTLASIQPSAHPNAVPSAHHRKIELQSYADLRYLQQNLAKAARGKLDLHFPPIPSSSSKSAAPATIISLDGPLSQSNHTTDAKNNNDDTNKETDANALEESIEEDPLRARVRQLIDTFLTETHSAARHSISINGIDASSLPPLQSQTPSCSNPEPPKDEAGHHADATSGQEPEIEGVHYTYEPFDPRLQKKLAALHGELESLTAQVSKLRRDTPQQAAAAHSQALEAQMRRDDEEWEAQLQQVQTDTYPGLDVLVVRNGWNDEVRDTFGRGVEQLAVLSGVAGSRIQTQTQSQSRTQDRRDLTKVPESSVSLTETVGRAQRARDVAMEFE